MPTPQHRPFLRITKKHEMRLGAVQALAAIIADLGGARTGQTTFCADLAAFYKLYAPAIEIDGVTLTFSPERPPQPWAVAEWLLSHDADYERLDRLERWVQIASPRALMALRDRLALSSS